MGGLLAGLKAGAPVAKFNPIAGATVGAIAGLGTMWATFLSDDLERAYEEGAQDTEEMGMMKAAAAAGGQTALNALGYILLGGYAGVKGLAVGAGASESRRMAAGSFAKAMERLNKRGSITKIAAVVAEEEVAEVGQQALEAQCCPEPLGFPRDLADQQGPHHLEFPQPLRPLSDPRGPESPEALGPQWIRIHPKYTHNHLFVQN